MPSEYELIDFARGMMSSSRFEHSMRVCEVADKIARLIDPDLCQDARLAGILHDITKELSPDEHLKIIRDANFLLTEEDEECIPNLHSISAVPLILKYYPMISGRVLSAIYSHCVGDEDMSLLDKIVYLADYIEPGREYDSSRALYQYVFDGIDELGREALVERLNSAVLKAADNTKRHVASRNQTVHSKTCLMIASIENEAAISN